MISIPELVSRICDIVVLCTGRMGTPISQRLWIAASLFASNPSKRHADLGRSVGLTRQGFSMRLMRYRKATGQHRPRARRFRFRLVKPAQLSLFD